MQRKQKYLTLLITLILLSQLTNTAMAGAQPSSSTAKDTSTVTIILPKEEEGLFNLFWEVKDIITRYHTSNVSSRLLYEGILSGLLGALNDPYSQYLNQEQFDSLSMSLKGEYGGIGVTIDLVDEKIMVISTFENSPAERAGIRAGDILIEANGTDLQGKMPQDVSAILRGPVGTQVSVKVKRLSTGEVLQFNLVRALIVPPTLNLRYLGSGLYYVKISEFTSNTATTFSLVMKYLRDRGAQGLILDLRDNPGGLLDACIEVAKELVPRGPIVELRGKESRQIIENDRDTIPIPTVVLVNQGTASAAEIVAAAIRDRGVGILVGERTFGKACVQTVVPLGENMGGIRLTIADYYTPCGKSISRTGLQPDIIVKPEPVKVPDKVQCTRPLRKGLVGLDVLALQQSLKFLGYEVGEPDGIFGTKTEKAWIAFCREHNLSYAGRITADQINLLYLASVEKARSVPDTVLDRGIQTLRKWVDTGSW